MKMNKKRTDWDFSNHKHTVEIFKCGEKTIRVDHFREGELNCGYVCFTNTDRTLTVTGDFGNWVFHRPFVPHANNYVSEPYWLEKLRTNSIQIFDVFDSEQNEMDIQELIDFGLEEYGYEGEELQEAKEWFSELLGETDDDLSYLAKAYRDSSKPNFIDYEMIPANKNMSRIDSIFDAFDEICKRLMEAQNEKHT